LTLDECWRAICLRYHS